MKARAEGAGLTAVDGLVERPERLIASLVGTGFEGLGILFSLPALLLAAGLGVDGRAADRCCPLWSARAVDARRSAT